MIISLAQEWDRALEECVKAIKSGKLIVYPTDTVYGIGGNALEKDVLEKVCAAKKRPASNALSVMIPNLEMLLKYFEVSDDEMGQMADCMPGPFTFILKAKAPMPVQGENGTVGVRIPNHIFMRRVCYESGVPIITTSANLHGQPAPIRFPDIAKEMLEAAEVAIDGGETMLKGPSTVVNIMERKIERKGVADFTFR
jgi:L-threonylcarbamoyladenylate synthase